MLLFIKISQGGYSIFQYYKSIVNALKDLFPDVDFDLSQFKPVIPSIKMKIQFHKLYKKNFKKILKEKRNH